MTISGAALAAKKVIDAAWLHGDAYDLSSQAAFALESAQLLMSPEMAAELERLQARVAELETERHTTNEALSDAAVALRAKQDRIAELEQQAEAAHAAPCRWPASPDCTCPTGGITRRIVPTQALAEDGCPRNVLDGDVGGHSFKKGAFADSPIRCRYCGAKRPESADEDVTPQVRRLRGLLAGQRAAVEDPHDSLLHHTYRVGRDLPESGGGS